MRKREKLLKIIKYWKSHNRDIKEKNYGFASKAELIDASESFQRATLLRIGVHKTSPIVQFRYSEYESIKVNFDIWPCSAY